MTSEDRQDGEQGNNQRTTWEYHPTLTKMQYGHPMAKIAEYDGGAEKETARNFD